jgi:hypothetical protein
MRTHEEEENENICMSFHLAFAQHYETPLVNPQPCLPRKQFILMLGGSPVIEAWCVPASAPTPGHLSLATWLAPPWLARPR